jgi:CheY-like chemotaxis protein
MEPTATAPSAAQSEREPHLALLLADDDPGLRFLIAARASRAVQGLIVLEAEDGAQAVRIGVQQRPLLALLDVQMPRLDGIEAATTLRDLHPQIRLALYTAEPDVHRDRARRHRLPLFDKLDADGAIDWLESQAQALVALRETALPQKLTLECCVCGYGAACSAPPDRCPMCRREATWTNAQWRPPSRARLLVGTHPNRG